MLDARLPNTMPFLDMPVALLERSAATRAKDVQCVSLSGVGLPRKKHTVMLHDRRSQPGQPGQPVSLFVCTLRYLVARFDKETRWPVLRSTSRLTKHGQQT